MIDKETASDGAVAYTIPAIRVDRVFCAAYHGGARLTFIENGSDGLKYPRTAVFLSLDDALGLRDLLTNLLNRPI